VSGADPKSADSRFLCHALAGLFAGARSVGIGANSPVPAAAALLARRADPAMRVTILGSPRHNPFTNGGAELFDNAAQGRLETFVIGALQIDGAANLNLVSVGDPAAPTVRYPGSFGSGLLYYVVPRVVVFREEHSPRSLVERVDFISAAGSSEPGVHRPGGPSHLLTGRALFRFDRDSRRLRLASLHPGNTLESVREATGFDFECDADPVPETGVPDAQALAALAGPIADELFDIYPAFAARLRQG
jgi:glutaconate CoA-transferase subunit B